MTTKYGTMDISFPKNHEKIYKNENRASFFGRNAIIKSMVDFIYADIYGEPEKKAADKKSTSAVSGFSYP